MRIYVASSFEQKEYTREAHKRLIEAGHEITLDWTTHKLLTEISNSELEATYKKYVKQDVNGVLNCDVFILLLGDRKSAGAHVELGIAIGSGKRIMLVGEIKDPTLFYWHPNIENLPSVEQAIKVLGVNNGD